MSPEAIELPDGMRRLKVGRPSDVWSLGCILYQMVYGHPPFQHLSVYHKMKAIPDSSHIIEFPEMSVPSIPGARDPQNPNQPTPPKKLEHLAMRVPVDVIKTMKQCLARQAKDRATIPELLEDKWFSMQEGVCSTIM
jgi:serine/threonine-protein kinase TTK/MPS1